MQSHLRHRSLRVVYNIELNYILKQNKFNIHGKKFLCTVFLPYMDVDIWCTGLWAQTKIAPLDDGGSQILEPPTPPFFRCKQIRRHELKFWHFAPKSVWRLSKLVRLLPENVPKAARLPRQDDPGPYGEDRFDSHQTSGARLRRRYRLHRGDHRLENSEKPENC